MRCQQERQHTPETRSQHITRSFQKLTASNAAVVSGNLLPTAITTSPSSFLSSSSIFLSFFPSNHPFICFFSSFPFNFPSPFYQSANTSQGLNYKKNITWSRRLTSSKASTPAASRDPLPAMRQWSQETRCQSTFISHLQYHHLSLFSFIIFFSFFIQNEGSFHSFLHFSLLLFTVFSGCFLPFLLLLKRGKRKADGSD